MPVLRKRENIVRQLPGGAVQAGATGAGWSSAFAGMLAKRAAAYGASMAAAAEDEAIALSKAATFSTGPNGLPQMPPDPTLRMGEIARRTYDHAMQERFAHQMGTAIQAQLNDAHNANFDDLDAFTADAEARLSAMALDIPPGYEGMFQQVSTGLMVDMGARIGYRQAVNLRQEMTASAPGLVDRYIAVAQEAIIADNPEGARAAAAAAITFIDSQQREVLDEREKQALRNNVYGSIAFYRLVKDLNLAEAGSGEITDLHAKVVRGDDKDVMAYFEMPDGSPADEDVRQNVANRLNQLLGEAYARENADAKRRERENVIEDVREGHAAPTPTNAEALDFVLGGLLNMDAPVTVQDWMVMGNDDMLTAIRQVKTTGFLPDSLTRLFRMTERGNLGTADTEQAFRIFRQLQEQPNWNGKAIDLTDAIGPRTATIFSLVDALYGNGALNDATLADAIASVNGTLAEPWTNAAWMDGWNNGGGPRFRGDEGDFEDWAAAQIREDVYGDATVFEKEIAQSVQQVRLLMQNGESYDDAIKLAKQMTEGRLVETRYMGNTDHSRFAPERWYADQPPEGVRELVGAAGQWVKGHSQLVGEAILNAPNAVIPNFIYVYDAELGGAATLASTFDQLASDAIQDHIEAVDDPVVKSAFETREDGTGRMGKRLLEPDVDYIILPDASKGYPPVYTVNMRGPRGTTVQLRNNDGTPFILDVRADFEAAVRMNAEIDAQRLEEDRWIKWMAGENPEQNREFLSWDRYMAMIANGDITTYRDLVRAYAADHGGPSQ